jgi:hypothetical protein
MTTLRKRQNQYRTVKVDFECFPEEINVREYELHGHLQGQRINRLKGMNIFDFDVIVWLKTSRNSKNKIEFLQCLGVRNCSEGLTTIILKKKRVQLK